MPRQKKPNRRRTDIYIDLDDPAWNEIVNEADLRGVTVQQHLYDLIRARWLSRQGQVRMAELFWLPGEPPDTYQSEYTTWQTTPNTWTVSDQTWTPELPSAEQIDEEWIPEPPPVLMETSELPPSEELVASDDAALADERADAMREAWMGLLEVRSKY